MALVERDLNRRNSKSSIYSAGNRDHGGTSTDAAVLSMLKTTTETGDIGSLSVASSRLPRLPNALHRRQNKIQPSSSRASSHYSRTGSRQGSIRSAKSQRSGHDTASDTGLPYHHRRFASSQEFPIADNASYITPEHGRSMTMTTGGLLDDPSDRAYSLTQEASLPRHMNDNRSITSLRSQGHPGRPRSPYVQTSRFNPGYRPSSPALTDTAGVVYARRPHHRLPFGPRAYAAAPQHMRMHPDMMVSPSSTSPGPRAYFKPSRPFDDLKRSFMRTGNNSGPQGHLEQPECHRRPLPFRAPEYGPAMPHAYPQSRAPIRTPPQRPAFEQPSLPYDAAPYTGFVQRVRNVLEEKLSQDDPTVTDGRASPASFKQRSLKSPVGSMRSELIPKDHDAPPLPEIPASLADEVAPESNDPSVKRLTRDLIKAGMDGMSDVAEMSDVGMDPPQESMPLLEIESSGSKAGISSKDSPLKDKDVPGEFPDDAVGDVEELHGQTAHRPPSTSNEQPTSVSFNFRLSMMKPTAPGSSNDESSGPGEAHKDIPKDRLESRQQSSVAMQQSRSYRIHDGDSARPLSMPQPTLQANGSIARGAIAKSLPPLLQNHSGTTLQDSDSDDDQRAIRLSTIRPRQHSGTDASNIEPAPVATRQISSATPESVAVGEVTQEEQVDQVPELPTYSRYSIERNPPAEHQAQRTSAAASTRLSTDGRAVPSATRSGPLGTTPRASAIKNFHAPLPDLTEDSQEDASTTNLRMLGMRAPMFRSRQVRDIRPPSRMSSEAATLLSEQPPPHSYFNMSIGDSRNIPSFNFSRVDLTTKLNKALGFRFSRSFEDFTQGSLQSGDASYEERPGSSTIARERYKSFFVFDESSEEGETDQALESIEVPPGEAMSSATNSLAIEQGILSEIDRLSIPSVKHLTTRLSELLPNIHQSQSEGDLDRVDEALKDTLQELRDIGATEGRGAASREAVESSQVAGQPSTVPSRGDTTKSAASRRHGLKLRDRPVAHLMKELPPLPNGHNMTGNDDDSEKVSLETAPEESVQASVKGSVQGHDESELEGTAVDNTVSTILQDLSKKGKEPACAEPEDAATRQQGTPRPWNNQESYPWSNKTPPIKLQKLKAVGARDTSSVAAPGAPELGEGDALRVVRSMSPGFNETGLIPVLPNGQKNSSTPRKGLFKSLTNIVGLKSSKDLVERSGPSIDPHFLHPEDALRQSRSPSSERRVDHGDRYPTTSLVAPDDMQVDAVGQVDDGNRSFFSNSSESEHAPTGFRKRFTRFRTGRSAANVTEDCTAVPSPDDTHGDSVVVEHRPYESEPAINVDAAAEFYRPQAETHLQGMSKSEVRAKRLVDKLRFFIYKGGERLKSLTKTKKRGRFWYEPSASENVLYRHAD